MISLQKTVRSITEKFYILGYTTVFAEVNKKHNVKFIEKYANQ